MQIKIGLIGSPSFIDTVLKVIQAFPTFMPLARSVEDAQELPAVAEQLAEEAEVLLLSNSQLHRIVKNQLSLSIPVHYVPLTGTGLYKSLFHALLSDKLTGGISVDSLTKAVVMRTLQDLNMEAIDVQVYDGPAYAADEKLVAFHQQQAAAGCTVALTGSASVAQQLSNMHIANELLAPSEQDIIVSLERALLSTESRRSKEAQIVVGMINVDDFGKMVLQRNNEHEIQKLKLDIHRTVLGYVESLDGYLTVLGGDEFLFFTTRGIFERETGGYKMIPLAKDVHKAYGVSFSLGVGFGISANEAGTNARAALRKAKEAGGNTCFIIREDKTLIGPLEMADPVQVVISPTHSELIKRVEEAGMTSAYLSKLLNNMARIGKDEYKAIELASLLNISVRSAHRLLLQWMDHGLVEIAGVEKVPRGRPRQIFRFTFLE